MNFNNNSSRLLAKILIGQVYLVFFAVQLFFNFDSQGISLHKHQSSNSNHSKAAKFDSWEGKSHHPSVFRLNKRFQPVSTPELISFDMALAREFSSKPECHYVSPSVSETATLHRSLRAPPIGDLS